MDCRLCEALASPATPWASRQDHWGLCACMGLVSTLVMGQVDREWVGLRPGRDSVRLEAESIALPEEGGCSSETLSVIHCYGAPNLADSALASPATVQACARQLTWLL